MKKPLNILNRNTFKIISPVLLILCFLFAASPSLADLPEYKKFTVKDYEETLKSPLEDRVYAIPDHLMNVYIEFDKDYFPEGKWPKNYTPTDTETQEIKTVIGKLPAGFASDVSKRLLGVFLVENLLGSGLTDYVIGDDGKLYFFVLLNPDVLKLGASDWITKKERSAFGKDDPSIEINIDIGGNDTSAFYYIFMHELMHVYDYARNFTPGEPGFPSAIEFVENKKWKLLKKSDYPFTQPLWNRYREPVKKFNFSGRDRVTFYALFGPPKLKLTEASKIYSDLEKTPFVTLYGAMSWMEDFAEYGAVYFNSKVLGRPWSLTVKKDGETIYEVSDLFQRKYIDKRMKFIEEIMSD